MALIKADRVRESSTTTGTGAFTLSGAEATFRTFSSVCATNDTVYYTIAHRTANEWETGLGTYSSANTLTRTTVHASSNSGAVVNFSAGTKEVFLALTARHLDRIQDNGQSTAIGSKTSVVAVNDSATLPDLDLQFADLKTLTAKYGPTPSYSRASTGTYFNASGVLTSAAVNEPRFDHVLENGAWVSKGLLIEEQRTNIILQSSSLSTSPWSNTDYTITSATSPDGTSNAKKLVAPASTAFRRMEQSVTGTAASYTISFFAKSAGWDFVQFCHGWNGTDYVNFNLSNGTISNSAGATGLLVSVGSGWYRCSATFTAAASSQGVRLIPMATSIASRFPNTTGDGVNGITVFGVQVELGNFSTSHIPTTTTSVIRSADVCQITGSAFTNLWNATEGSYAIDYDLFSTAPDQPLVYVNNGTANESHRYYASTSPSGGPAFYSRSASVTDGVIVLSVPVVSSGKAAIATKLNDIAGSINSLSVVTDSSVAFPTGLTSFNIGVDHVSTRMNGRIARLRYFRSRLDNTQLVNLSGGINTLAFKPVTGSGSVTVANEFNGINISVPNPLPITNGGTGATTGTLAAVNLVNSAPNDGQEYTLKSKKTGGTPTFYWVDGTGYAPALDLLFAADKSLTAYRGPTPSFSRASTGTFFNSFGVLTSAAINTPRFNHTYNGTSWVSRGLLVEEQRTNDALNSNNHAVWGTAGATPTKSGTWLDGSSNQANLLTISNTNNRHIIFNSVINASGNYVFSVFLKKGSSRYSHAQISDDGAGGNRYGIVFDFDTGTSTSQRSDGTPTGTGYSISNYGNGWFRVSLTLTKTSSGYITFAYGFSDSATPTTFTFGSPSYTGNGTDTMYGGGAQLELGSFATSYIPTTSASVTRSADVCQITGSDFSGFWNGTEGTLVGEYDSISSAVAVPWLAGGATTANGIGNYNFSFTPYFLVKNSNVNVANIATSATTAGSTTRTASGYKDNDFAISINGAAVVADTSGTLPTNLVLLQLGNENGTTQYLNGHIARLRYYPVRLPNATLQTLST